MTDRPLAEKRFAVGLTGGIGSGKTAVADLFASHGAAIIDTDQLAHRLTSAGGAATTPIRAHFGDRFFDPAGAMDRAKMRAHVFAEPAARQALEAILHPLIRREAEHAASLATGNYLIFVVPLLIESGQWKERLSRVLVIDCPRSLQIRRVMERSGLSEPEVVAILAAQASREARLAAADDVIENDGTLPSLAPKVAALHAFYCTLAGAASS